MFKIIYGPDYWADYFNEDCNFYEKQTTSLADGIRIQKSEKKLQTPKNFLDVWRQTTA